MTESEKAAILKTYAELAEEFQTIAYTKLENYCNAACLNGRYVLLFDQTNQCADYFVYKALLKDFYKDVVAHRLGAKTKEETFEDLRRGLVATMRLGQNIVINLDNLTDVDWTQYALEGSFPEVLWEYEEWRKYENYMTVVRPEEDHGFDSDANKAETKFMMHDKFNMIVLCSMPKDEIEFVRVVKSIPHYDEFECFIVKEMTKLE